MSRVSAQHAAKIAGVTPTTLHRWVRTGRLPRHPDGYEVAEVLQAADSRSVDALLIRLGKTAEDRALIAEHMQKARRVA